MSEFQEQKKLIEWFKSEYPELERCVRLSMNGVNLGGDKKAAIIINQMRSQGMVLAESDLFFAVPHKYFSGLFIEMKDYGKTPTHEQQEYLDFMGGLGYAATWCQGFEAAKEVIQDYMRTRY